MTAALSAVFTTSNNTNHQPTKSKIMTYLKQSALSNCMRLAFKIGRVLDVEFIMSDDCSEQEVRDLQDILIEDYNRKLAK